MEFQAIREDCEPRIENPLGYSAASTPVRAIERIGFDDTAPSSRGLGHHPLKVEARVRIPLGLPNLTRFW